MNDSTAIYEVFAEPGDIERLAQLPKKLNEVSGKDTYKNYLDAYPVLYFVKN